MDVSEPGRTGWMVGLSALPPLRVRKNSALQIASGARSEPRVLDAAVARMAASAVHVIAAENCMLTSDRNLL